MSYGRRGREPAPSDPEDDVPPGPVSVVAYSVSTTVSARNIFGSFQAMRKRNVVLSLRSPLRIIHAKSDEMLDAVMVLDPEGRLQTMQTYGGTSNPPRHRASCQMLST